MILNAEDKLYGLEYEVFCNIREQIAAQMDRIQSTAKALAKLYDTTLIYCFELPGVMRTPEDADSLISTITCESYRQLLADGVISGGMIPKMDNAFNAIVNGVTKVIITKADAIDGTQGTHIIA